MKKIVYLLMFAITLILNQYGTAQNPQRFPLLRERIAQAKLREIRLSLNLDQPTFERFRPVYLRYEREVSDIDFRSMARLMRVDADSLSAEEADQMIRSQMETAKRLIEIREKYYHEFRQVIRPQQIIKLYQTEAEIRKKVMQEFRRRIMSR